MVSGARHRHVEQQMLPAARHFHQPQRPPVHQRRRAAQHGVGAFHRLHRHAGALADRHALPDVESRERAGDAASVGDVASLPRRRLAPRQQPLAGQQRLQQQRRIHQPDALRLRATFATPPISASVFFAASDASSLTRRQSGRIERENLRVLHLPGHRSPRRCLRACRISISRLSSPSEIQWQRAASGFDFRGRLFLDRDRRPLRGPACARGLQRQQRESGRCRR